MVDPWRGFAWCGSHDHNLYVLDTATETCVYSHDCGGSIYGAAAFDVNLGRAYVVTTKGHVVAFDGRSCQVGPLAGKEGSGGGDRNSGAQYCSMENQATEDRA